jgi:hypothetical protein
MSSYVQCDFGIPDFEIKQKGSSKSKIKLEVAIIFDYDQSFQMIPTYKIHLNHQK